MTGRYGFYNTSKETRTIFIRMELGSLFLAD